MMRNHGQFFGSIAHDAGVSWSAFIVSTDRRDGDLFGPRSVIEPKLDKLLDRLAGASPSTR